VSAAEPRSRASLRRDLADVGYWPATPDEGDVTDARYASRALVAQGVEFAGSDRSRAPWLVAGRRFDLGADLARRIERLGAASFELCDAAQAMWAEGDPRVAAHLDPGVPEDLRGLDLDRTIQMLRLDVVIRDGRPVLTEIEEVFGNVGKAHAFEHAYGVSADPMYEALEGYDFGKFSIDDQYAMYRTELEIVARRMKEQFGRDVRVELFSEFTDDGLVSWRFCYVKEFRQYGPEQRARILKAADRLVNPLFHGYGTKGLLSLAWDPELEADLVRRIGADTLAVLRAGMPRTTLLAPEPDPAFMAELKERGGRDLALKVLDAPEATEYTWGSRGVFFGDQSAGRWRATVDAAAAGAVPGRPEVRGTRYMLTELVDSDRFDVTFLHPFEDTLCLMPRARIRLTPIFNRGAERVDLLGGHATFVNTSRKVHLGKHAVCAPFAVPVES
jgi:hypothetical protein